MHNSKITQETREEIQHTYFKKGTQTRQFNGLYFYFQTKKNAGPNLPRGLTILKLNRAPKTLKGIDSAGGGSFLFPRVAALLVTLDVRQYTFY
jgi:hypothetical protein